MDLIVYVPWQLLVLFGAGIVLGASITVAAVLIFWNRAIAEAIRRLSQPLLRASRTPVIVVSPAASERPVAAKTPVSERPTLDIKQGVIPFVERPTLVFDGDKPDDMIPTGPPVWRAVGEIDGEDGTF
jgi:hypothetical protein